ncbi:MAG: hypothetical protein ACR5LH_17065 [Sodalis sp. (in: enterobacteria)]
MGGSQRVAKAAKPPTPGALFLRRHRPNLKISGKLQLNLIEVINSNAPQ